jgi:hypothetical protein
MYISASFIQFAIYAFFLVVGTSADNVHKSGFRHEAVEILKKRHEEGKRQTKSITVQAKPTISNFFYTIITPSPGATPVKVTKQSRLVTQSIQFN